MIKTDICINGTQCMAENYKGLLFMMKDTGRKTVKCVFTLWGQDAHKANLTLAEVERLANETI